MKKLFILFAVISLFACKTIAQDWITYIDKENRFSVDFPGSPNFMEAPKMSGGGISMGPSLNLTLKDSLGGKANFLLLYTDYTDKSNPDNYFDLWIKIFVGMSNCRSKSEKDITQDGFPGKYVVGENVVGMGPIHFKFLHVKNRVYSLGVECNNDSIWIKSIDKFFSSFRILEN